MLNDKQFEELYEKYSKYIYTILKSMLYSDDSIEDLMQEVLFRIAKAYPCFASLNQEKSWVINVTRNTAIDFFRRSNKTSAEGYYPDDVALSYLAINNANFQMLTSVPLDTGQNIFRQELSEKIIDALNNINETDKKIFLLKFAHNLTMNEITAIVHIHRSSVHRSIDRTRAIICPIIDEYRRLA